MNDAEIAKVLRGARDRIAKPENWGKRFLKYHHINGDVCLCSYGAILEELVSTDITAWSVIYQRMCDIHGVDIICFNDRPSTTHSDVMNMFNNVITVLEDNYHE